MKKSTVFVASDTFSNFKKKSESWKTSFVKPEGFSDEKSNHFLYCIMKLATLGKSG